MSKVLWAKQFPDSQFVIKDAGCWMLDAGCWMLGKDPTPSIQHLASSSDSALSNFGPLSWPKLDKVESGRNNYQNSA
jgi:hypothetical protein